MHPDLTKGLGGVPRPCGGVVFCLLNTGGGGPLPLWPRIQIPVPCPYRNQICRNSGDFHGSSTPSPPYSIGAVLLIQVEDVGQQRCCPTLLNPADKRGD